MVRSKVALTTLPLILGLAVALPGGADAQQAPEEDAGGRHTVERGESLWNLARRYYDDPFQWRRIYEANTGRIDDPHWIYPGQRFLIPGIGFVTVGDVAVSDQDGAGAVGAGAGGAGAAPGTGRVNPGLNDPTVFSSPPRENIPTPESRTAFYGALVRGGVVNQRGGVLGAEEVEYLEVSPDVFYSTPWTDSRDVSPSDLFPGEVSGWAGAEGESRLRSNATINPFDEIEIAWRGDLPAEGTLVQLVRVERSDSDLGRVIQPTGIARVVRRGETRVVAVVENAYRRPRAGDFAQTAPSFDLQPGEYAEEGGENLTASLGGYARERVVQQPGDVAFLSVGTAQGVAVGDVFAAESDDEEGLGSDVAFTMKVVRVFENRASARIQDVRVPTFPTDARVRRVRQMP